jgi:hypothetical protein
MADVLLPFACVLPVGGFADPAAAPRDDFSGDHYHMFGSSMARPLNLLSNFAATPIRMWLADVTPEMALFCPEIASFVASACGEDGQRPLVFPSSEHVWQALKARDVDTFLDFTLAGRWGQLDTAAFLPFYPKKSGTVHELQAFAEAKVAHWGKKQNVGILAKMATSARYTRSVGGKLWYPSKVQGAADLEDAQHPGMWDVWLQILRLKYAQNDEARVVLLATGDTYLLEFSTKANQWGGHYHELTDKIVGRNYMGCLLMALRKELKQQGEE